MRKAVAGKKVIKEEERGCDRKMGRSRGRKPERQKGNKAAVYWICEYKREDGLAGRLKVAVG